MDKIERIVELVNKLNEASYAYYGKDDPIISDKQYDDFYNELTGLENETGFVLAGSPTLGVQGYILDRFNKVTHSKPMLSADKTKDTTDVEKFLKGKDYYASFKLDGLTLVTKYKNGRFVQGITRGNGIVGEDVTEQCKFVKNLPMRIPYQGDLELRGECLISWQEFERINRKLDTPYSHPRNLAAGTLRNLDLNIVKERNLSYIVFECVTDTGIDSKFDQLNQIQSYGFEIGWLTKINCNVEDICNALQPKFYKYPTDGIVFEVNSRKLSESLGATSHHECCRIALKWEDDLYETELTNIEWNTSRTGLINPVAIFKPVDLDGAITTRATLHNISYIEELELGIGDTIQVYRSNMVIPKVHDNLTRSNTCEIPTVCPCCGAKAEIHNENGSKTLHCTNPFCSSKLISRLTHFVSRKCMNIEGMSESTIEKLVDMGWVNNLYDIYNLDQYYSKLINIEGFGSKSVNKLRESINKSKAVELKNFISAVSIPGIGPSQATEIAKVFKTWDEFQDAAFGVYNFSEIEGFGEVLNKNIHKWFDEMWTKEHIEELVDILRITNNVKDSHDTSNTLKGMIFVITGSLNHFENREKVKEEIEKYGGKVSGSVSNKTNYLVNNDINSESGKNKRAKELGVPIISEDQLIEIFKNNL